MEKRASVVAAGAIVADAIVLRINGRVWWCKCGSWVPWSWQVNSRHNSQHLVDAYSFTHVLHGLIFYGLLHLVARRLSVGWRFAIAACVEALWEMVENSSFVIERYRAATISLDYYGDSIANSCSDIACCLLGFWIASKIPAWASFAMFVAIELILAATIRDNLTMNIIMLLYPIDALRRWQQGG